jgi:hypothetical protein
MAAGDPWWVGGSVPAGARMTYRPPAGNIAVLTLYYASNIYLELEYTDGTNYYLAYSNFPSGTTYRITCSYSLYFSFYNDGSAAYSFYAMGFLVG